MVDICDRKDSWETTASTEQTTFEFESIHQAVQGLQGGIQLSVISKWALYIIYVQETLIQGTILLNFQSMRLKGLICNKSGII